MIRGTGFFCVLVVGCGPGAPISAAGTTGEGSSSSATSSPTTGGGSSGGSSESGGTESSSGGSSGSSGETDEHSFLDDPPDFGTKDCDAWMQDCSAGEKCVFYADDGGSFWNATKCVPVMEDAVGVGEACFVVGDGISGIDNCDASSFCWDVNAMNEGTCVAYCTGSGEDPMCLPGNDCIVVSSDTLFFCRPWCDPLVQDCGDGQACIDEGSNGGRGFVCIYEGSLDEGQAHDSCENLGGCDSGLHCVDPGAAVECDQEAEGCCEPFCDLTAPNTCPGAGQVCVPYFAMGEAAPGFEDVGVCTLP